MTCVEGDTDGWKGFRQTDKAKGQRVIIGNFKHLPAYNGGNHLGSDGKKQAEKQESIKLPVG